MTKTSGGEFDFTHALGGLDNMRAVQLNSRRPNIIVGRGGELDGMHPEYSESLAAYKHPRQVTSHARVYAVHRVDGCARTRFVYFLKNVVDVEKRKVTAT